MSGIFQEASNFDANLSSWDVSRVRGCAMDGMDGMFYKASKFDHRGLNWDLLENALRPAP